MKTLPWALCRPSIVTMMRAADAGPAIKIEARADAKNRLRQRMLRCAPLGLLLLSTVAKILGAQGAGLERSVAMLALGRSECLDPPLVLTASHKLAPFRGACVSMVGRNRESRVKNS